jgi:5-methylcytosine-specific restriction protein A
MHLELLEEIDSSYLQLDKLLINGLNAAPQGPIKLIDELRLYIETHFSDVNEQEFFPDYISERTGLYEGAKIKVQVNRYERNSVARGKCIEYHGCKCSICGMDFEEKFGELGKGFIHIHHIVPISEIDEEYQINYQSDLIPVCPNCHSMLHRKVDGKNISVKELRLIIREVSGLGH